MRYVYFKNQYIVLHKNKEQKTLPCLFMCGSSIDGRGNGHEEKTVKQK